MAEYDWMILWSCYGINLTGSNLKDSYSCFFGGVWITGLGDSWNTCSFSKILFITLQGCSEVDCLNSLMVRFLTGVSGRGFGSFPSSSSWWSYASSSLDWSRISCCSSIVLSKTFESSSSTSCSICSKISFTSCSCCFISSTTSMGIYTFWSTKAGFISLTSGGGKIPKVLFLICTSYFSFFLGILVYLV